MTIANNNADLTVERLCKLMTNKLRRVNWSEPVILNADLPDQPPFKLEMLKRIETKICFLLNKSSF